MLSDPRAHSETKEASQIPLILLLKIQTKAYTDLSGW